MLIRNGFVLCENKTFQCLDVSVSGGMIRELGEGLPQEDVCVEAAGKFVIPGLVDIHTHGAAGADFSDGDGAAWQDMGRVYSRHGTTAFLAATMTLGEDTLSRIMDTAAGYKSPEYGAMCLGVHLEGPFLSYSKRGAQSARHLHIPDIEMFSRLYERSGNRIRLVTVAPEEPGALEFIRIASRICAVSIGHTAANYEQAVAGFCAGATHVTHLFNAMPPLLHREPGVIGAAADLALSAELICDGLHVHPAAVRCAQRIFGERLVLVSDSIRCAGMPDGEYELGGQPVTVINGKAMLRDGTLAGSTSFLLDYVRKAVEFGLAKEAAVWAATAAAADCAGMGKYAGRILPGRRADILLLDQDLRLKQVMIGGRPIFHESEGEPK